VKLVIGRANHATGMRKPASFDRRRHALIGRADQQNEDQDGCAP
jgi:hypothetical protein